MVILSYLVRCTISFNAGSGKVLCYATINWSFCTTLGIFTDRGERNCSDSMCPNNMSFFKVTPLTNFLMLTSRPDCQESITASRFVITPPDHSLWIFKESSKNLMNE